AARDRMNSVFDGDAALLEHVCKLAHGVLCLRSCESVTRYEYDFVCVSELCRDVVESDFAHRSFLLATGCGCRCASKRAEQNVRHRAIHRTAHQDREYESGKPVERARDDEHFV